MYISLDLDIAMIIETQINTGLNKVDIYFSLVLICKRVSLL